MKISQGLARRDNGIYYARRRVPKHLVTSLKKHEIKISLRTTDRSIALARLPRALKDINHQLALAEDDRPHVVGATSAVSSGVLKQIARQWFSLRWEHIERDLSQPLPAHVSRVEAVQWLEAELFPIKDQDRIRELRYLGSAQDLLKRAGHHADDASIGALANYLKRGDIDLLEVQIRHWDGDFSHQFRDPLFITFNGGDERVDTSDAANATRHPVGLTVGAAIDRFLADPQRAQLSSKNGRGYATGFKLLCEIVGRDSPLSSVGRGHARKMQQILSYLPPNATKLFPKMTLLQAADYAKTARLPSMQRATAANTLSNMSAFFRWATDEHLVAKSSFNGLKPLQEQRSKEHQRQPFTDEELAKLFSGEIFEGPFDAASCVHPGRYWVPLLALYHGARLNEICQLETADIVQKEALWCLKFTTESATGEVKNLKTESAERTVPVHPIVLRAGFIEYCEFMRKRNSVRLFPDLTIASSGYYSDNFSKWFARYRKARGVSRNVTNFHSFRHGFNDACRAADVPAGIVEQICGWAADDSMVNHYGTGHTLQRKAVEIAKVRFPAVERLLPALQGVNSGLEGCE